MTFIVMSISPDGDAAWISADSVLSHAETNERAGNVQKALSIPGRFIFADSGDGQTRDVIALAATESADVDAMGDVLPRLFASFPRSLRDRPWFAVWAGWSPSLRRIVGFTSSTSEMTPAAILSHHIASPPLDATYMLAFVDARIAEAHEHMARRAMARMPSIGGTLHMAKIDPHGIVIRDVCDLDRKG